MPGLGSPGQTEAERRACARPELAMHYDVDGRFQLRYSAPATVGALVEQALKEAKDALFLAASGRAPARRRPSGAAGFHGIAATDRPTHADALEELAQRSLSSVTSIGRAEPLPGLPAPLHRRCVGQRRPGRFPGG